MKSTYKLYMQIKQLKDAAKNPRLTRQVSWELAVLASELERKYEFLVKIGEELKKDEHSKDQTNRGRI